MKAPSISSRCWCAHTVQLRLCRPRLTVASALSSRAMVILWPSCHYLPMLTMIPNDSVRPLQSPRNRCRLFASECFHEQPERLSASKHPAFAPCVGDRPRPGIADARFVGTVFRLAKVDNPAILPSRRWGTATQLYSLRCLLRGHSVEDATRRQDFPRVTTVLSFRRTLFPLTANVCSFLGFVSLFFLTVCGRVHHRTSLSIAKKLAFEYVARCSGFLELRARKCSYFICLRYLPFLERQGR